MANDASSINFEAAIKATLAALKHPDGTGLTQYETAVLALLGSIATDIHFIGAAVIEYSDGTVSIATH